MTLIKNKAIFNIREEEINKMNKINNKLYSNNKYYLKIIIKIILFQILIV
jgi:hypothetical protein